MEVRKTFRISREEEETLLQEMRLAGVENISDFIRQKIFPTVEIRSLETIIDESNQQLLRKIEVHKLEKIFLELHKISILSEATGKVAEDNMKIVMRCFRELLIDVGKNFELSEEFRNQWL